jgi:phage repressor protein C with HTH and peptisase S24 domain
MFLLCSYLYPRNHPSQEKYDYIPNSFLTYLWDDDPMLSHEQIWKAIDRLAESHGYSTSGLAKRAGLDPTTFNRSKRFSNEGKERWPSTESISRILALTKATLTDFVALVDNAAPTKTEDSHLPLLPMNKVGQQGYFDETGAPNGDGWNDFIFPGNDIPYAGTYALEIPNDSLQPVYRTGDIIILSSTAAIKRGQRVMVRLVKGTVVIGNIVKQSGGRIDLTPLNPDDDELSLRAEDVSWMARILWVSQ